MKRSTPFIYYPLRIVTEKDNPEPVLAKVPLIPNCECRGRNPREALLRLELKFRDMRREWSGRGMRFPEPKLKRA